MLLSRSYPRFLLLPKIRFSDVFLFLYFVTLHADRLGFTLVNYNVRVNNLLGGILFLILLPCLRKSIFSEGRKWIAPFLAIGGSIFLSLLCSSYSQRCLFFFIWYWITVCGYFFLPFALLLFFEETKIFRMYFCSFVCVGIYACLQFLVSWFGLQDPFVSQIVEKSLFTGRILSRPSAMTYEPSFYALYFTPFVMVVNLSYFLRCHVFFPRGVSKAYLVLVNVCFLISMTMSAFVSYLVLIVVCLFFSMTPLKKKIAYLSRAVCHFIKYFLLCFFPFFFLFPHFATKVFLKFFFKESMHSYLERITMIGHVWKIFVRFPLWGIGYGAIPPYLYENCISGETSVFYAFEKCMLEFQQLALKFFEPSNVLMEILASLGIVGLGAFAWLLGKFFKIFLKVINSSTVSPEEKQMAFILFTSVIVQIVCLQFCQGLLRTYIWVHFAFTCAFLNKRCSDV